MPLPNFIIIGAMKSGTSTLHSNLKHHPDIGMSYRKEPNFFNKRINFLKIDWYKRQFSKAEYINGESSPNYSKVHMYPSTAKNMYDVLPDAKIIHLARDPIERIESHLHHNLYRDRLKLSEINKVVLENENYILTSSYSYQLKEYLKYYPIENFLFLTTDQLKDDLNGTLNSIYEFLGVESCNFAANNKNRNKSSDKFLIKNYDFLKRRLPKRTMRVYHKICYLIGTKIERPVLSSLTKSILKDKLFRDVLEYKRISGNLVPSWKNF